MKPPIKKFIYKLDTVFNFGRYKGSTLQTVILSNANYVSWCIETVEDFEMDKESYKLWDTQMGIQAEQRYSREFDSDFRDAFEF